MFDIEKMMEEHAESERYAGIGIAKRAMEIGRLAPPFLTAMGESLDAVPSLAGSVDPNLFTWRDDCPYVTYTLAQDEAIADMRKVAHEMVTRGWLFEMRDDSDDRRIAYIFTKPSQKLKGALYVYLGSSKHCSLVVESEEVVPATTRKKYKIQCDERTTDNTPLELMPPAHPDGDEEQDRPSLQDGAPF